MQVTAHVKIKQTPAGFTCPYTSEVLVPTDLIASFWSDLVSWCITNHCMVITFVDVLNRYLQALTEVQASTLMWHLYFLDRYGCRALSTCYQQFDHVPPLASPLCRGHVYSILILFHCPPMRCTQQRVLESALCICHLSGRWNCNNNISLHHYP